MSANDLPCCAVVLGTCQPGDGCGDWCVAHALVQLWRHSTLSYAFRAHLEVEKRATRQYRQVHWELGERRWLFRLLYYYNSINRFCRAVACLNDQISIREALLPEKRSELHCCDLAWSLQPQ